MVSEEGFNQFVKENIKDPALMAAPPAEDETPAAPAVETPPATTPETTTEEAPKETQATEPEATETTEEEVDQPRDAAGRFVKVAVHAQEMSKRDTIIQEREAKIAELEEALAKAKAEPPKTEQQAQKSIAKLEALKEKLKADFPEELQELVTGVEGELLTRDEQIAKLQAAVDVLTQDREAALKAQQDEVASDVNASVDAHPDLKTWAHAALKPTATAAEKALWNAACDAEEMLSKDPDWAAKPTAERYAKAAEIAALAKGVQLTKTTTATPKPPAGDPKPLPPKTPVPASLSAARPSTTVQPPPAYAGENLSQIGALKAVKGLTVAEQQRILLGVGM